ncbi:MAG: hypothetical protein OXG81_00965 [Acidobacteria bacterium]|nr:hypothetical protein [Acidobacteriota bacterium]
MTRREEVHAGCPVEELSSLRSTVQAPRMDGLAMRFERWPRRIA